MKRVVVPKLILSLSLFSGTIDAQEKAGAVQRGGDCSVNIVGNNNTTASLVCHGIDPKLAEQVRAILNQTRRNQDSVRELSEKLDRILMQLQAPKKALSLEQQKGFTELLKAAPVVPESTQLSCPEADEDACIYAAGFIPLFQRAGWVIEGPAITRVKVARPTKEIVLVIAGPPLIHPQNPDEGVWTKMPNWMPNVHQAFEKIGIQAISWNDTSLPENRLRVYFGSATPSGR